MMRSDTIQKHSAGKPDMRMAMVTILLFIGLLVAVYAILRHGGRYGEIDSAAFSTYINDVYDSGRLVPGPNQGYTNGYGYSALGAYFVNISGLSQSHLQLYVAVLLAIWIVLPAWLLYRELTPTNKVAVFATLILLFQPDFLFPILRGTHEKFTRGLMLLALYLLIRSIRSRSNLRRFTAFVLSFYLAAFAMITLNSMLSSSFILAIALALGFSWLATRRMSISNLLERTTLQRLFLISVTLIAFTFLFIFYLYSPARHDLLLLNTASDQLATLFLDVESAKISQPYQTVSFGWINLPVYFAVSSATWLLLATSALIWLGQSARWLIRGRLPQGQPELLLWAFYGAFAAIGAITVVTDMSGFLSSNLQVRAFPAFAMLAAPLVAAWLINVTEKPTTAARFVRIALGLVVGLMVILSVIKATNEPLVSNKWSFYIPGELAALKWAETSLDDRTVWAGFDERLQMAKIIFAEGDSDQKIDAFSIDESAQNLLISDIIRIRGLRLGLPLPTEPDNFTTYDNGRAQINHRRPRTPFQR